VHLFRFFELSVAIIIYQHVP